MGKATKWFRAILGLKKPESSSSSISPKKKWSFAINSNAAPNNNNNKKSIISTTDDENNISHDKSRLLSDNVRQASVATVAVSGGGGKTSNNGSTLTCAGGYGTHLNCAAVVIQSHFRAYLSRRALRALKALVKLQALVRGHLMRKRTADALRQLQALVRAQTRARFGRVLLSESPHSSIKSSHFSCNGPATPEKFENVSRARSMKHEQSMILKRTGSKSYGRVSYEPEKSHLNRVWMDSRTGERLWEQGSFTRIIPTYDERSDKILEVDTGKPHATPKRRNLFHSSHLITGLDQNCQSFSVSKDSTARQTALSPSSGEVQSLSPLKFTQDAVESVFCTADNSPQFYSASSSKREVCTPTKSDGSRSMLSGYSDHPNYMSYTESSKAKVRSLSAPRQRPPQYERSSSTKRYSVHGYGEPRSTQRVNELHANFASKAYPGSGRLDRLGMPVRGDVSGFSGGHWLRY